MLIATTIICVLTHQIISVKCANILAVIPTPSRSHQTPFQPLWAELSLRGHQVTVITTDPVKNSSLTNLTEIDISFTYKISEKYDVFGQLASGNKTFLQLRQTIGDALIECQEEQLSMPEIRNLIKDKSKTFDVVLVEAQSPIMLAFGWKFDCPVIAIASLDAPMNYHDAIGDIVHPVLTPDFNLNIRDVEDMSFKERLMSYVYMVVYKYLIRAGFERHHDQARRYFGYNLPPFEELLGDISAIFHNTHPLTHYLRATNVNSISLGGGMHIKGPQPLPKDIQTFLDEANHGAVYFALGGNIKSKMLPDNFTLILLEAFSELPYKFLFKIDEELKDVPSNVKVLKWAPQQDILRHPNLKVFVTHGGLQSLQETIYNGVPVLGIPFYGDAFANINRAVKLGYGRKLELNRLNKLTLQIEIIAIAEDSRYKEKALEVMEIYRNEEVSSLDRAVYWVEYIIKFKGAKHLKSNMYQLSFWEFYMLDVIGFIITVLLILLLILYYTIRAVYRTIRYLTKPKHHQD